MQIISPLRAHLSQKSSFKHRPARPFRVAFQPEAAETSRNSFARKILQGTPLF
jgi:hypothetical protein